jgi:hypothetical protein
LTRHLEAENRSIELDGGSDLLDWKSVQVFVRDRVDRLEVSHRFQFTVTPPGVLLSLTHFGVHGKYDSILSVDADML